MFIRRLKPNIYDVFMGNGWNHWARVQRHGKNVHQVAGAVRLTPQTLNEVKEKVSK